MSYELENKSILLTGATSGIGEQLCVDLAKLGNRVIACGRNQEKLESLKAKNPEAILTCAFDTGNKEDVLASISKLGESQNIDLAILNAGTCEYVDVDKFESEMFERVMQVNFLGTVYCIEALLPLLRKSNNPYLAIMSSSSVFFPFTRAEAYGASKAALSYLSESLRVDLAKEKIHVSSISPGFVKTPLTDKNDFAMPMAISPEQASKAIIKGLQKQALDIHFPKAFTRILKMMSLLPQKLQFIISQQMVKS